MGLPSIACPVRAAIRWSYPVGAAARRFTVSDTHLVIWQGSQLYIVDENGNPTYNESLACGNPVCPGGQAAMWP